MHGTYGSSEKIVRQIFQLAAEHSPSLIFIDEFDGLFTERASGSSSRLTSTLLSCMDEIVSNDGKEIGDNINKRTIVLAASNVPWSIDEAFYSRFDRCIHVSLPDETELLDILKTYVEKMKLEECCCEDSIYDFVSPLIKGFSGADIAALCRAAAVKCLLEGCNGVNVGHFQSALEHFKPSSDPGIVRRCKAWHHK